MPEGNLSIGFRAEKDGFTYAVIEKVGEAFFLKAHDVATAPTSFTESARLAWLRNQVMALLNAYKPEIGSVRFPESLERSGGQVVSKRERSRVEGVILEALGSKNIGTLTGPLSTASKYLQIKKPKDFLADAANLAGIEISKFNPKLKEAILYAVSALAM